MSPRWSFAKALRVIFLLGAGVWIIVILIGALITAFAKAAPIIMPPTQYIHPFYGRQIVEYLPEDKAKRRCFERHILRSNACSWWFADNLNPGGFVCHIIYSLVTDVGEEDEMQDAVHEVAHCNGWPADHRGGHY